MDLLYLKCAGLDVHPRSVSACTRLVVDGQATHEVRTFGTSTRELRAMADWLSSLGCTHVAMESTGVYWKPVWHVLEDRFELVLANAMYIRNIPGRKSDVKDAVWIADLLAHGLLRGSFVPPEKVQDLRDLTRTRKQLTREITRHTQRIQKTLEDANVKLNRGDQQRFGDEWPRNPPGPHRRRDQPGKTRGPYGGSPQGTTRDADRRASGTGH